jgi:hypothetical protein
MRRREFIAGVGSAAALPLIAGAQKLGRLRRIGVLMPYAENDPESNRRFSTFTKALVDLGWTEGHNVRVDLRSDIGTDRMRALAHELVDLQPDVILTGGTPATAALHRETQTIPIVFVTAVDPVASGIVPRLDRPRAPGRCWPPIFRPWTRPGHQAFTSRSGMVFGFRERLPRTSYQGSMPRRRTLWPTEAFGIGSASLVMRFRPAPSRYRRCSANFKSRRSRGGGPSSKPPTSSQSELDWGVPPNSVTVMGCPDERSGRASLQL